MSKYGKKNYGYGYEYNYNYGYGYGYGNYDYGGYNYVGARSSAVVSAKPKEMTEEEKQLFKAMAAARSKVYASYEEAIADENPKVDSFFPSPTGWMCLQRRKIDDNELIFIKKADKCPLIDAMAPRIEVTINNKIPKELLVEIVGSFARICNLNGNEAAAQIYREKEPAEGAAERKYVIYYPEQTISGAQVSYANDLGMLEMRKTHELIMELHSHNRMQAFWSGTDNANEKDCGFYMVIGTFGSASATYKCRVKYGDLYMDFPAHNIFDMSPEEEVELLKRENWTEGNPIIEQKAKAHSVTHAVSYTTAPRTVTQFGKGNTGLNSGSLPENMLTKYNELLGETISSQDPLSTQLMRYSKYDTARSAYICNSHAFSPAKYADRNWHPIDATLDPLALESSKYITKLEDAYSKNACLSAKPNQYDYTYHNSGAAAANYLVGNANDMDAKRVSFPGFKNEYRELDFSDYKPGINDDALRDAVNNMAVGRICAVENIQSTLDLVTGDAEVVEFNEDFRKTIATKLDGLTANVKPALLWELFTTMEKARLSTVFGETVVNLGQQFTALQSVVPEFILFVFWAVLVPENYRLRLMNAVDVVREVLVEEKTQNNEPSTSVQIVQGVNDLLAVNKDLFVDIVGVKSKVESQEGEQDETTVSDQN